MNSKLGIGKRLFSGFAAILTVLLATSGSALYMLTSTGNEMTRVVTRDSRSQFLAGQVKTAVEVMISWERGVLVRVLNHDPANLPACNKGFRKGLADANAALDELSTLATAAEDAAAIDQMRRAVRSLEGYHEEFWAFAIAQDEPHATPFLRDRMMPFLTQTSKLATGVIERQVDRMQASTEQARGRIAHGRWVIGASVLISLAAAVFSGLQIIGINRALGTAISDLSRTADEVGSAAGQVSASSQSLAQAATEQASSLEETSASTTEISSMAESNRERADSAAQFAGNARSKFEVALRDLDSTDASMAELSASSDRIARIIKVIDEIAFQTNILALNAAVEAARAGQAGMGFAVVADEVRNLAQRSAKAAKDTADLIADSIEKSRRGKSQVDGAVGLIRGIAEDVRKVQELVEDVRSASSEQARGTGQISQAVTGMEEITQRSAATAEQSAAAAEELDAQVTSLRDIVGGIDSLVHGARAAEGFAKGGRREVMREA